MPKIIIENRRVAKLEEHNKNVLYEIGKLLSYKIVGVEYTPAFRNYGWDGTTYIMNKKGEFPLGLLSMVQDYYKNHGIDIEVDDRRPAIIPANEIDISKRLKELGKEPYYYQKDAVEKIIKCERGVIKAATGAGKSLIAAMILAKLGKKGIVHVIGKELLQQFHKDFEEIFQKKIGIVGDGKCEIHDITICSIWTSAKALGVKPSDILVDSEDNEDEDLDESNKEKIVRCLQESKIHIYDECHVSSTKTIQSIYYATDPELNVGLSGTPWRSDGADILIKGYLGERVVDIPASLLIKEGFLSQPIIKFITVPAIPTSGNTYQEIYKEYIVENETRNNIILQQAELLVSKGYQVLVLFGTIRHGKILNKLFSTSSLKYDILDGNDTTEKRNQVKQKLLNNELNCVIASRIYDIGINVPTLSALILGFGGKSSVRALQRVGRVIRKYKNRKFSAVVDFVDSAKYLKKHSKVRKEIYQTEDGFKLILPKGF